jgi:hypothetical protein
MQDDKEGGGGRKMHDKRGRKNDYNERNGEKE